MDHAAVIRAAWNDPANAARYRAVPADVVIGQAMLETGNFTSTIFRENRNAFGMKLPASRPTLATGENRGHAVYNSVADSVRDYVLRQRNFGIPDTGNVSTYMRETVESGYATDPNYLRKWAAQVLAVAPPGSLDHAAEITAVMFLILLYAHR